METDTLGKYTNWPGRKSFTEEWKMVQGVVEEKDDIETIEIYLAPLVPLVMNNFRELHPDRVIPDKLFDAAFMYLPNAIKHYAARRESGRTGYGFSHYYEWWMRQGFLDYPNNKLER